MNAQQGWNAAQLASERVIRKKVMHGPVGGFNAPGEATTSTWVSDETCDCGYHVCSCAQVPVTSEVKACGPSCSAPNCCCDKCWAAQHVDYEQALAVCESGGVVQFLGQGDYQNWVFRRSEKNSEFPFEVNRASYQGSYWEKAAFGTHWVTKEIKRGKFRVFS